MQEWGNVVAANRKANKVGLLKWSIRGVPNVSERVAISMKSMSISLVGAE